MNSKNIFVISFSLFVFFAFTVSPVFAWVQGIEESIQELSDGSMDVGFDYMEEDSMTNSALPNNNYGTATVMYLGGDPGSKAFWYRAYMKDFTCPDDSVVDTSLFIYASFNNYAGSYISCSAPNASWSESTITWNNQPGFVTGTTDSTLVSSGMGYMAVDCTSAVQYSCGSGDVALNNGLVLHRIDTSSYALMGINPRELSNSPYVVVNLSVDLADFFAMAFDNSITVFWETSEEVDNLGWNIYRATEKDGIYEKINGEIIPAYQYDYEYVDKSVEKGVMYYYKVEDVELSGKTTMHGPVSAILWGGIEDLDGDDSGLDSDMEGSPEDSELSSTSEFDADRSAGCGF